MCLLGKISLAVNKERLEQRYHFIKQYLGDAKFSIESLPQDASFRSYHRVLCGDKSYILMNAPPEKEGIEQFIKIGKFLQKHNLNSPKIFALNEKQGFLLLQDFGDILLKNYLLQKPEEELKLYQKSCDVLLELAKISLSLDVPQYDEVTLKKELQIFVDWFPHNFSEPQEQEFWQIWQGLLNDLFEAEKHLPKLLVLRDFHAENLMILQNQNLGILDFQDALIGNPAYDLASLLQDARREVSQELEGEILKYYLSKSKFNEEQKQAFKESYDILSMQRNLKILGIFHRLHKRDGKEKYLQFLPLVKNYVMRNELLQRFDNLIFFNM